MTGIQQPSKLAVIGLGYVGLPLAVEFAKHMDVVGFDVNQQRIDELLQGQDNTLEVSSDSLTDTGMMFTSNPEDLRESQVYIVTVPTPIDSHNQPDLTFLLKASETVSNVMCKGDIVIYESTVYPGASEEVCVPILESGSGLLLNRDFFIGYSPERINPGDKQHTISCIKKVTSGSCPDAAEVIDALYQTVVKAGTHKASSIKVAEAAKVIENTQRDVNIALINELAIIFEKMGIDTEEVLQAAATKWNFLHFHPGLVGGHCIGVDPYYLTYKAQELGYHPEMILAGRRINDEMGAYLAGRVIRLMLKKRIHVNNANVLVMGLTFKENCPDLRNSKVIDLIKEFQEMDARVDVYDPWADVSQAKQLYGLELVNELPEKQYDAVVIAVAHRQFKAIPESGYKALCKPTKHVIFDAKNVLDSHLVDGRL